MNLLQNETKAIITHIISNNSVSSTILYKLYCLGNTPSLNDLLQTHPTTINYLPYNIVEKYKTKIIDCLSQNNRINIYDENIQLILFKDSPNILNYGTVHSLIKNSSNPLGLHNSNHGIFPLSFIYDINGISQLSLQKINALKKIDLSDINIKSFKKLRKILGRDESIRFLESNIESDSIINEFVVYKFHKTISSKHLLNISIFKKRAYLKFLIHSKRNKDYLYLFLKNTKLNLFYILNLFNESDIEFYLMENKYLSANTILKINSLKSFKYLDWVSIYSKLTHLLTEDNLQKILENNPYIKEDLISLYVSKHNNRVPNISKVKNIPELKYHINKEIKLRFSTINPN